MESQKEVHLLISPGSIHRVLAGHAESVMHRAEGRLLEIRELDKSSGQRIYPKKQHIKGEQDKENRDGTNLYVRRSKRVSDIP